MHTRDEAWTELDHSFKAFMDSLGHLTEEELTAAEVVGKWSVKDVVAHVWSWVDEAVQTARKAGATPSPGPIRAASCLPSIAISRNSASAGSGRAPAAKSSRP